MDFDPLSDVLRNIRLSGAFFFDVDIASPWVAAAPASQSIASSVLPGSQHVIEYHILTEGECWARITGESDQPPTLLSPGSIITFPQGDPHILASAPELDAEPNLKNFDVVARAQALPLQVAEGAGKVKTAHLICGFLGCDVMPFNPLISGLPRVVHIPGAYGGGESWLSHLIAAAARETRARSPGSDGVLSKLSELIFIEAIRQYATMQPADTGGWLAGLSDPGVGRALTLLHAAPAQDWTLASLARAAGVSRTVLAERFSKFVGMPPITYLANWRMQRAATMISEGTALLSDIAAQLGYASEAAFSRAFKRHTGLSPTQWREKITGEGRGRRAEECVG